MSNNITNAINLLNQTLQKGYRITSDVPATNASRGISGTIAYDANYIYICIATDTWKRVAVGGTW